MMDVLAKFMKTEIISFYSDVDNRTYYSDHAKRLQKNCERLSIPCDIRELQSKGDYRLNCLSKPKFILDMLIEKQKPVVWMDVDSIIHRQLTVFDEMKEYDLGFAYQIENPNASPVNIPKASPIYFNYNSGALDFLKYWIECCAGAINNNITVFDHELLMFNVIPKFYARVKIARVNIAYAIWPGTQIPENMTPMITMGIADGEGKEKLLRDMNMPEDHIQRQLIGNKYSENEV